MQAQQSLGPVKTMFSAVVTSEHTLKGLKLIDGTVCVEKAPQV